jgi:hypothetical protein
MSIPQPVLYCTLGGLSVQVLNVIDGLKAPKDRRPDFRSIYYYIAILLNIGLSTILGIVYFDEKQQLNKVIYFHIGVSAPLIMRSLATTVPEVVRSTHKTKNPDN